MFKAFQKFTKYGAKYGKSVPKRFFNDIAKKNSVKQVRKNPFTKKNNNLFLFKRNVRVRKASSLSARLDSIANSIPKSALLAVGAASGLGIAALTTYGLFQGEAIQETRGLTDTQSTSLYGFEIRQQAEQTYQGAYSSATRWKLAHAYGYFAGALGVTAASAVLLSRSPLAFKIHSNPWLFLAVGGIGTIAAMFGTYAISYHESPVAKHLMWGTFASLEGLCMAPITILGGPLIANAVLGTACIVGTISLITAVAPNENWRAYSSIYGIGLGVLLGASLGMMFFPHPILYNIWLYGGLAIHGWGVYRGNSRIIESSKNTPVSQFDPINESISLYIHTLAIFYRMVMMLSGSSGKRR